MCLQIIPLVKIFMCNVTTCTVGLCDAVHVVVADISMYTSYTPCRLIFHLAYDCHVLYDRMRPHNSRRVSSP